MIKLLKCEYRKTKGKFIMSTALIITVIQLCWALYNNVSPQLIKHGWMVFLYQFPLINAIFMPILSIVVASRICDIEHKGNTFKYIFAISNKGKIFDAKFIYGLVIIIICNLVSWSVIVAFGFIKGFGGDFPLNLYLLYLIFTIVPTIAIYIFQFTLSIFFKNQAVTFFIGIIGEFLGVFSMFLAQFPFIRKSLLWGYYGVLQFVGMFGWTKEARMDNIYFEVMNIDWLFFGFITLLSTIMYFISRKLFCKKEV